MAVPTGFQVGLELTNVAAPLGGVMGRLCNLALVDALKRSGSDIITEAKMTALIGRHRIDEAMKKLFKNSVAPSSQMNLSRYMDIALNAGAGPTVQEALRDDNPAHFSMILQLSLLSYACQDETLAYGITTAIESMLEECGGGLEKAPDYVSLLGTIRACRQQTTAFQWNLYYDDVMSRVKSKLQLDDEERFKPGRRNPKRRKVTRSKTYPSSCSEDRSIAYHVLKTLIAWVPTFQNFPEEYTLHIKTSTGINTIVIWCYYVLGISISVWMGNSTINFGEGSFIITLEAVQASEEMILLLEAKKQNEPLFTLSPSLHDPPIESENREEAFGFARKILKPLLADENTIDGFARWATDQCLHIRRAKVSSDAFNHFCPTDSEIRRAGAFLFAYKDLMIDGDAFDMKDPSLLPTDFKALLQTIPQKLFTDLIITFSRIANLDDCKHVPLSLNAFELSTTYANVVPSLFESFEYFLILLAGEQHSKHYRSSTVLHSTWGWSTYLACFASSDPCDADVSHFYVKPGVPTRKGTHKIRIIDAPSRQGRQDTTPLKGHIIDADDGLTYFPGISSASRGPVLVGNQDEHTFSVIQVFKWRPMSSKQDQEYRLGFREMLDLRQRFLQLPPCSCRPCHETEPQFELFEEPDLKRRITNHTPKRVAHGSQKGAEKVICMKMNRKEVALSQTMKKFWMIYVSQEEASRWLQMSDLVEVNAHELKRPAVYVLRHRRCCLQHAVEQCKHSLKPPDDDAIGIVLL